MPATPSTMVEIGTPMPRFALEDVRTGEIVDNSCFSGAEAALVVFICNHCPFVVHIRDVFLRFVKEYQDRGVKVVAISANDPVTHEDDSPENLKRMAEEKEFTFPYLFDESQDIAKAFGAACTPDFFLYGPDQTLFYRGQFDDSRPGNESPVTGDDLRTAIDALLSGMPAPDEQRPSMGCSIKWRSGNEPSYFPV